ncbi:MAG: hypothetical protein NXI31_01695 [bacterium]|nr:hypothetical protein [bacterium]
MTQILTILPREHDALDGTPTSPTASATGAGSRRWAGNAIEVGLAALLITAAAASAGALACEALISLWDWGQEVATDFFANLARWFRMPRAW